MGYVFVAVVCSTFGFFVGVAISRGAERERNAVRHRLRFDLAGHRSVGRVVR